MLRIEIECSEGAVSGSAHTGHTKSSPTGTQISRPPFASQQDSWFVQRPGVRMTLLSMPWQYVGQRARSASS